MVFDIGTWKIFPTYPICSIGRESTKKKSDLNHKLEYYGKKLIQNNESRAFVQKWFESSVMGLNPQKTKKGPNHKNEYSEKKIIWITNNI